MAAKKSPQKRAAESSAATRTPKKSKTEAAPPAPSTLNAAYLGQIAAWLQTIAAHFTFKDAKDLPMGVPILMKNICFLGRNAHTSFVLWLKTVLRLIEDALWAV